MSATQTLSSPASSSTPVLPCPRCQSQQPWGENSWCPDCGYYPTVDRGAPEGHSWADALPEVEEEGEDNRTALESIPGWFWLMVAGMTVLTASSAGIRVALNDKEGMRGLIALAQLTVGAIAMLVAHLLAARFAMQNDRRIQAQDILLSWFNVWQPTIASLPRGCKRLLSMVWGMVAVITAVAVIGGIDYSAPFRTDRGAAIKATTVVNAITDAARAQAEAEGQKPQTMDDALRELQEQADEVQQQATGSMEDALQELKENSAEMLKDASPEDLAKLIAPVTQRSSMEATVYGVRINDRRIPTSFLFAATVNDQPQHVSEIFAKDLKPDVYHRILRKLNGAVQPEPQFETTLDAIWVKPVVTCRLSYQGTQDGILNDPAIEAFVLTQRGSRD